MNETCTKVDLKDTLATFYAYLYIYISGTQKASMEIDYIKNVEIMDQLCGEQNTTTLYGYK